MRGTTRLQLNCPKACKLDHQSGLPEVDPLWAAEMAKAVR